MCTFMHSLQVQSVYFVLYFICLAELYLRDISLHISTTLSSSAGSLFAVYALYCHLIGLFPRHMQKMLYVDRIFLELEMHS